MRYIVELSRLAEKQVERLPAHIRDAFRSWQEIVEKGKLRILRRSLGYHDEPLRGSRTGQRSCRLNRSYRVIYQEIEGNVLSIVAVIEVNKHEY